MAKRRSEFESEKESGEESGEESGKESGKESGAESGVESGQGLAMGAGELMGGPRSMLAEAVILYSNRMSSNALSFLLSPRMVGPSPEPCRPMPGFPP